MDFTTLFSNSALIVLSIFMISKLKRHQVEYSFMVTVAWVLLIASSMVRMLTDVGGLLWNISDVSRYVTLIILIFDYVVTLKRDKKNRRRFSFEKRSGFKE